MGLRHGISLVEAEPLGAQGQQGGACTSLKVLLFQQKNNILTHTHRLPWIPKKPHKTAAPAHQQNLKKKHSMYEDHGFVLSHPRRLTF